MEDKYEILDCSLDYEIRKKFYDMEYFQKKELHRIELGWLGRLFERLFGDGGFEKQLTESLKKKWEI